MRTRSKFISLTSVAALTLGCLGGPALAVEPAATEPIAILLAASRIAGSPAGELLEDIEAGSPSNGKARDSDSNAQRDGISSQPVIVRGMGQKQLALGLPFSNDGNPAKRLVGEAISFDNRNGTTSVVIPKTDGSTQVATIIEGYSAPTTFNYRLFLPAGGRAVLSEHGTVLFVDNRDEFLGAVAPAWAVDAQGRAVRTRYELHGNFLTQVVDHRTKETKYPVIADPWFGVDMIDRTSWVSTGQYSPTLSVYPSSWGRAVALATTYPFSSGLIAVVDQLSLNAAWSETLSKTSRTGNPNPDTPTMFVQFECHYFWVSKRSPRKVTWNLDSKRPYGSMAAQAQKNCNVE
ncbi:MAG: hypothetical protein RL036_824 [Actinomycetota bacterium]